MLCVGIAVWWYHQWLDYIAMWFPLHNQDAMEQWSWYVKHTLACVVLSMLVLGEVALFVLTPQLVACWPEGNMA